MIKCENNDVDIVEPDENTEAHMLADLTLILHGLRDTFKEFGFSSAEADEFIKISVVLSDMSSEELDFVEYLIK